MTKQTPTKSIRCKGGKLQRQPCVVTRSRLVNMEDRTQLIQLRNGHLPSELYKKSKNAANREKAPFTRDPSLCKTKTTAVRHKRAALPPSNAKTCPTNHWLSRLTLFYLSMRWFPRAPERRVLLNRGGAYHFFFSHLLIFTSTHIIFSPSHLLIFTSAHLHITYAHIFTSAHVSYVFFLPPLLFIILSSGRGRCQRGSTKWNLFPRNEVRSGKTSVKLRCWNCPRNPLARNEVRSANTELKWRLWYLLQCFSV